MNTIKCVECDKEFTPLRHTQKYCCEECSTSAKIKRQKKWHQDNYQNVLKDKIQSAKLKGKKPIICGYCGTEFVAAHSNSKYCCLACKSAATKEREKEYQKNYREKKNKEKNVQTTILHCIICGKEIDPNSRRNKYCSDECARLGNIKNTEKSNKKCRKERLERKRRKYETTNLDIMLRKIEKYNEKHGTKLSYGQYVALVERNETK